MPTFTVVTPLHSMIRNALTQLKDARKDADPDHDPLTCPGPCVVCLRERHLNRLVDRLPVPKNIP